jgi:DMSO/TMAO reductase YedYZ molybdopterin-dependent catalytic subunit
VKIEMADQPILLVVDGAVAKPLRLRFDDLAAFPPADRVEDVSRFHPTRKGSGVTLEAVLRLAEVSPEARYITLHADRDDFHVPVPLEEARGEGIVVFHLDGKPLDQAHGGPIRFIIRDPSACHTGELDDCANVKYLSRMEVTTGRGRDTRPTTDAEHAALHEKQG